MGCSGGECDILTVYTLAELNKKLSFTHAHTETDTQKERQTDI